VQLTPTIRSDHYADHCTTKRRPPPWIAGRPPLAEPRPLSVRWVTVTANEYHW